jgi:peptidoglycan hydrolase-like protein with peptidoglycan-binding domain
VSDFQADHGLISDGHLDPEVVARIEQAAKSVPGPADAG